MKRDADEVLGHLQRHHTREGIRYRFHRRTSGLVVEVPEPIQPGSWRMFVEVIGGMVVFGGLLAGLWLWAAIAAASQS